MAAVLPALLAGLLVAHLRGTDLGGLAGLRGWPLLVVGVVAEAFAGGNLPANGLATAAFVTWAALNAAAFPSTALLGLGFVANFAELVLGGGRMPVPLPFGQAAARHVFAPMAGALGDTLLLRLGHLAVVYSLGDVLLAAGVFGVIAFGGFAVGGKMSMERGGATHGASDGMGAVPPGAVDGWDAGPGGRNG